ncbi:hypothetical protein K9M78_02790 [Candidatus Bipolaricaulota bacterium]|nr:hypothetical protein [Candidatus Bipolaricaulota bacterium]
MIEQIVLVKNNFNDDDDPEGAMFGWLIKKLDWLIENAVNLEILMPIFFLPLLIFVDRGYFKSSDDTRIIVACAVYAFLAILITLINPDD